MENGPKKPVQRTLSSKRVSFNVSDTAIYNWSKEPEVLSSSVAVPQSSNSRPSSRSSQPGSRPQSRGRTPSPQKKINSAADSRPPSAIIKRSVSGSATGQSSFWDRRVSESLAEKSMKGLTLKEGESGGSVHGAHVALSKLLGVLSSSLRSSEHTKKPSSGVVLPHNFLLPVPPQIPRPIFLNADEEKHLGSRPCSRRYSRRVSCGCALQLSQKTISLNAFADEEVETDFNDDDDYASGCSALCGPTFNPAYHDAFSEIVDHDPSATFEELIAEDLLGTFLRSNVFRNSILLFIVLVSVLVGVGTNETLTSNASNVMTVLNKIVLTVFVLELLLKWAHGFGTYWRSSWNVFDFVLVLTSIISEFLDAELAYLSAGRMIRVLRVLRALRTLRSITALGSLQLIVETILDSLSDLLNILMLLFIVTFIFAVVAADLLSGGDDFDGLGNSFWSLFLMLTQDGWETIFWSYSDRGYFGQASVICVAYIVIGAFVMINILAGVVFINLQVAYQHDKLDVQQRGNLVGQSKGSNNDGPVFEQTERVSSVSPAVWSRQVQRLLPDFQTLSPAHIENYAMVILAIEDNLAEFKGMQQTLNNIVCEVRDVNAQLVDSDDSDDSDDETATVISDIDNTDVISKMIRQEQKKDSRDRELLEQYSNVKRAVALARLSRVSPIDETLSQYSSIANFVTVPQRPLREPQDRHPRRASSTSSSSSPTLTTAAVPLHRDSRQGRAAFASASVPASQRDRRSSLSWVNTGKEDEESSAMPVPHGKARPDTSLFLKSRALAVPGTSPSES